MAAERERERGRGKERERDRRGVPSGGEGEKMECGGSGGRGVERKGRRIGTSGVQHKKDVIQGLGPWKRTIETA